MDKIYELLEKNLPEHDFRNSEDFLKDGFLDSFDVITIIAELEQRFDILIDPLDILPENFSSARVIADLVIKSGGDLEK